MLGAGCEDLTIAPGGTRTTEELLILSLRPAAPGVPTASFFAVNSRDVVRQLAHNEATFTLYLQITFPRGSLAAIDGTALGSGDSVRVTVQPRAGGYGLTLSPSGLDLARSARPVALFEYAKYGDLSVADGSPTYASRTSYAAALALWWETTPGRWLRVGGSGPSGTDQVSGLLEEPGSYVVAAPR